MRFIGIDIGSHSLTTVVIESGKTSRIESVIHRGDPTVALAAFAAREATAGPAVFRVTGGCAGVIGGAEGEQPLDEIRACVAGAAALVPDARHIMDIGGSTLTLISLSENGSLEGFTQNSLCAAGTGAFLDEQASRLGITYEDAALFVREEDPPPIATRCAVFAKSDITHRQQQGYTKGAMWAGLCKGLSQTIVQTLCRGRRLRGPVAVIGGVSRNAEVIRWLAGEIPEVFVPVQGHAVQAFGAALITREEGGSPLEKLLHHVSTDVGGPGAFALRPPLTLVKSSFPSFMAEESYDDDFGNEVRVLAWPAERDVSCWLGIDVGSTSTKAALVTTDGIVVADVYRRTQGDPISAVRMLFSAMVNLAHEKQSVLRILGSATTGSGRQIVGAVIGADVVVNEISAHARGASEALPGVETIFEIGGQDAKYIRLRNGEIADSSMNYICAAGTGSFIEEVGRKMGCDVREIGDRAIGVAPPVTSDRCTVFMEQDVHAILRRGAAKEAAMAAVVYSVAQNYLNKVVGRREISREKIVFQGATARNKALVAAFENLLGVEVVVSPHCHVMGAFGAALIARDRMLKLAQSTTFSGLELASREVRMERSECTLCRNRCEIFAACIDGVSARPSWGYMCGREPEETTERRDEGMAPFKTREHLWRGPIGKAATGPIEKNRQTVGVPRALMTWLHWPLWRTFLRSVGLKPVLGPRNSEEIKAMGSREVSSDFCFPVKVAHGQARFLLDRLHCDFVLAPDMIGAEENQNTTNSLFCPYVETFGSMSKNGCALRGERDERFLTPLIDLRWKEEGIVDELVKIFGPVTGLRRDRLRSGWRTALKSQQEFRKRMFAEGQAVLDRLASEGGHGIVFLGRAYNICDFNLNLSIPRKMSRLGFTVIPADMLPLRSDAFEGAFANMYWATGQTILSAARTVAASPNLHAVYFSNFKCGPDSFILSLVETIMGDKPMLTLEFDEHGADAGYMTRVEAFIDVLRGSEDRKTVSAIRVPESSDEEIRRHKIWIPPMHPIVPRLIAAAFRGTGWPAEALPPEDSESHLLGRSLVRGSECLPTSLTIGAFVKKMLEPGINPADHAFFMPRATGPCRFGQYSMLHRLILDRLGMKNTPVLSPCSYNTYMGLDGDLRHRLWHAIVIGDILFKCVCRLRPYERVTGTVDAVCSRAISRFESVFEAQDDLMPTLRETISEFTRVPIVRMRKPLVGIVGEIYIRANTFANQDLIGSIEAYGGEAWLAPLSEWIHYTAFMENHNYRSGKWAFNLFKWGKNAISSRVMLHEEDAYLEAASAIIGDRREPSIDSTIAAGEAYVPLEFEGEVIITAGRAVEFMIHDADLVINCSPFGCMPGTITTGLFQRISHEHGVAVLNIFYDGEGDLNRQIGTALANIGPRRLSAGLEESTPQTRSGGSANREELVAASTKGNRARFPE